MSDTSRIAECPCCELPVGVRFGLFFPHVDLYGEECEGGLLAAGEEE